MLDIAVLFTVNDLPVTRMEKVEVLSHSVVSDFFCDPMDCSPPDSSVHGILQVRILEWAAVPFSRGSSQPRDQTHISHTVGRFFTI